VVVKFAFDLEKAISDSKSQLWKKKIEIHSSCTLSELLDVPLGKRWQAFKPKPVFLCHDKFHRDRKICMDTLQAVFFSCLSCDDQIGVVTLEMESLTLTINCSFFGCLLIAVVWTCFRLPWVSCCFFRQYSRESCSLMFNRRQTRLTVTIADYGIG